MRRLIAMGGLLAVSASASAGPIIVWLEPTVPEARDVRRAEADAGPAAHLAHVDLAYPPQPADAQDETAYDELRAAVVESRAQWSEWDVEAEIARELLTAVEGVTVVRSPRDQRDLVDANLLLGAAASRAFPPSEFATLEASEPFRFEFPGGQVNRGWYQALSLDSERPYARADIADGAPFDDFMEVKREVDELPDGSVDLTRIPNGAQIVIDGVNVAPGVDQVDLRPGEHWFHVVRNGAISGRSRFTVFSGRSVDAPLVVDDQEIAAAKEAFLSGLSGALPDDVRTALDAQQRANRGGVFLAAIDPEGRVVVRPYRNAELLGRRPVTFLVTGEIGFSLMQSDLFIEDSDTPAPAASGGLGLEFGIYNFVMLGGFDAAVTPTRQIRYGASNESDGNRNTAVYPQPWGGVGVYLPRPNKSRATFLLAGTYGYDAPAHNVVGVRAALGLPVDDQGTWFRLTTGYKTAGDMNKSWRDADTVTAGQGTNTFYVRLGLGARL